MLLIIITVAAIQFIIFPNIDTYKDDIAAKITEKIGLKTTIGNITTGWDGAEPQMLISEINIYNKENDAALHLSNVKGIFSWLSIPTLQPHLSYISVSDPTLKVQRKQNGSIYIAGIAMTGEGNPDFANWLLTQAHIRIKNATIIWQDDMRQAPPLALNKVYLTFRNPTWRKLFGQHLFNMAALPSTGTRFPIKVHGNFFGRDVSNMDSWHGTVNLETKDIDLIAWKNWLDYPIDLKSGQGDAIIALNFSDTRINQIKADVNLRKVVGKVDSNKQPFNASLLTGTLSWEKAKKITRLAARNITLKTEKELSIGGGSGFVSYTRKENEPWFNVSANLDTFNLDFLKQLQHFVTLPDNISQPLNALSPQGSMSALSLSMQGNPAHPSHYHITSDFNRLSVDAYQNIPGINQLSGRIDADEDNGTLTLDAHQAAIHLKDILRWPIPLETLTGRVTWSNIGRFKIVANNIQLSNKHIHGTVNASYDMNGIKGGYLNLNGQFDDGNAQFAPFYYPLILGKDTLDWLDSSILSGKAHDVKLTVKGHLDDFPFVDKQNRPDPDQGVFKVSAKISDAVLEYGKNWPKIQGIDLDMLFEGNSMTLNAHQGQVDGINISQAKVVIPQLNSHGANNQMLNITGVAQGPTADGINFINNSPVKDVTLGFTDDLKTAGTGKLDLSLSIPLNNIEAATYKGQYAIQNGAIYANERMRLPEIDRITGQLTFNQTGIAAKNVQAEILGGSALFNLSTASDQTIHMSASGTATDAGLKNLAQNVLTESLTGSTAWSADIAIKEPIVNLSIRSNLKGLAINLPAPVGKGSVQEANLVLTKNQSNAAQDKFEIDYNNIISAIILRSEKNGNLVFDRGDIAINKAASPPAQSGLTLHGELDYLNADEWLDLTSTPEGTAKANQTEPKFAFNIDRADLFIRQLDVFNRTLHALSIQTTPQNDYLQLHVDSQEIAGNVEWYAAKNLEDTGKIIANLKKLHIPTSNTNGENEAEEDSIKKSNKKYPALNIQAEDFKLGEKALGSLALKATAVKDDWIIEQLKINSPDYLLLAEGRWRNWVGNPNTDLEFSLTSNDAGKTMQRFGQPDIIKGGIAAIAGRLQWPGSPHQFKKNSLNGEFTLGASKGQILKIKPGVGRLLGLLTLQSLPRRLTLDFRDLFSEGFAFDEISATARIENGVMHSDDFFMTGPAAETKIKGSVNLDKETQSLKVTVVPHISDTLSLAALAGGPIAGAAAFIAQKILKDPFNKIVQSDYIITGTWDNPIEVNANNENETDKPSPSPLTAQ